MHQNVGQLELSSCDCERFYMTLDLQNVLDVVDEANFFAINEHNLDMTVR